MCIWIGFLNLISSTKDLLPCVFAVWRFAEGAITNTQLRHGCSAKVQENL